MATLTGKKIKNTYDALIKIEDNNTISSTPKQLTDGLGNATALYLSSTKLGIGTSPTEQFHTTGAAKIGGDLTVIGNLTVNGTTTHVDSTIIEVGDNMIELAKDNTANTKDIGWYGTIVDNGEKYVGIKYDAGSGVVTPTFELGLTLNEPGNTADWSVKGKLVIGALDATGGTFSGQVTIPLTPTNNAHAASKKYVDDEIDALGEVDVAKRLEVTVKNVSGGSLAKGTVVHASPSATPPSGNVIEVIAADYDDATKMPAIGILNETIADEAEGAAVMMGAVSGIDTNSFSAGDELYVGNNGALRNSKPTATTQLIQKIAICVKVHGSQGSIKVFGAGRSNDVPNEIDRDVQWTGGDLYFDEDIQARFLYSSNKGNIGLRIQHNGSHSYIDGEYGNLYIRAEANDSDLSLQADDMGGGNAEYFRLDGGLGYSVASKDIRFDDSIKANFGTGNDLKIYHTADTASYIQQTTANDLIITNTGAAEVEIKSNRKVNIYIDQNNDDTHNSFNILSNTNTYAANDVIFEVTQTGNVNIDGNVVADGSGTFDTLTLTSGNDNLTFTQSGDDWTINNAQQNNGITIYDGTAGVGINYNGTEYFKVNTDGVYVPNNIDFYVDTNLIYADATNNVVGIGSTGNSNYKLFVNGSIATDSYVIAGLGSGGVALTHNDGYGNANIAFNHVSGTPEQNGNSFRIECNTDSSVNPAMIFELVAGVTSGVAVSTVEKMRLDETGVKVRATGGGILHLERNDTSIVDGNPLGRLRFTGDDPVNGTFNVGAEIRGEAAGTWSADNYPAELQFYTITTNTLGLALKLDSSQNATFGGDILISKNDPKLTFFDSTVNTDPSGQIVFSESSGIQNFDINYNGANDRLEFRGRVDSIHNTDLLFINRDLTTTLEVLGGATFAGDVILESTKKLYFDGEGDTYIFHPSDDQLSFRVGGQEFMRFTEDTSDTVGIYKETTFYGDAIFEQQVTIEGASPTLTFEDSDAAEDNYKIIVNSSKWRVYNDTDASTAFEILGDNDAKFYSNLEVAGDIDLTGSITQTGTSLNTFSGNIKIDQTNPTLSFQSDDTNISGKIQWLDSLSSEEAVISAGPNMTISTKGTITFSTDKGTANNTAIVIDTNHNTTFYNAAIIDNGTSTIKLINENNVNYIYFGDAVDDETGYISYNHNNDMLSFKTDEGSTDFQIDTDGHGKFWNDLQVVGAFKDSSGDTGTSGQILSSTGTGTNWIDNTGTIDGSGTADYIPKWSDADTLSDSIIYESGSQIGIDTTTLNYKLNVSGTIYTSGDLIIDTEGDTYRIGADTYTTDQTSGVMIRPADNVNPTAGDSLFVVRSGGGSPRLFVEHSGTTGTTNSTFTVGATSTRGNGNVVLSSTGDSYLSGGGLSVGTSAATGKFLSYISASRQLTHNGNGGDLSIISDNNSSPVMYIKGTGTADLLNVFDNTTEVFTITDGGLVGISANNPDETLHIKLATGDPRIKLETGGGGDPGIIFQSANNRTGEMFFQDGSTSARFSYDHNAVAFKMYAHNQTTVDFYVSETLAYFSDQNVSINRTTPNVGGAPSGTDGKLNVYTSAGSSAWAQQIRHDSTTGNGLFVRAGNSSSYYTAYFAGYDESNVHFVVRGDGSCGIGIDSPANRLHVYHPTTNVVAKFESGDTATYIELHDDSSGTYGCLLGHQAGVNKLFNVSDANVTKHFEIVSASAGAGVKGADFYTDGVYGVQIHGSGNSSEGGHLTLKKASSYTYQWCIDNYQDKLRIFRENDDGTGGDVKAEFASDGDFRVTRYIEHLGDTNSYLGWSGADDFRIVTGGRELVRLDEGTNPDIAKFMTDEFRMYSNGDFHADGDIIAYSTTASSDKRLKKNIKPIDNALDIVDKLQGVHFNWKKDDKKSIGYIAQDVEKVLPEMVKEQQHFNEGTYKTVNYAAMVAIMSEAIKELRAEVNELKKCNCNCK